MLLPDGEVELRLQRVQQHVDLVHDEHRLAPQLEHAAEVVHLSVETLNRRAGNVFDALDAFHVLQEDGLDAARRRDDDAPRLLRVLEFGQDFAVDLRRAVAIEAEDLLLHDAREGAAQNGPREVEQRRGHHLDHEVAAVGEHQGQERPDDGRLARSHDHLLHDRLVLQDVGVDLLDELALAGT